VGDRRRARRAAPERAGAYNIYRDGICVARHIAAIAWTDPESSDCLSTAREYAVEAVYPETGNHSHLSPVRFYLAEGGPQVIPASGFVSADGTPPLRDELECWGAPGAALRLSLRPKTSGRHVLRLRYANGWGINTGIACAVKRLEVVLEPCGTVIAADYIVMPQTAGHADFALSSPLEATLRDDRTYSLRLFENGVCRNMSYFEHNTMYTPHPGGGDGAYNRISLAAAVLFPMSRSGK
jgi:hypothetical protein